MIIWKPITLKWSDTWCLGKTLQASKLNGELLQFTQIPTLRTVNETSLKSTPSAEEKFMRHTFCCARYKQCFVFVGWFWEGSALWWTRSVLRYFQHPKKFINLLIYARSRPLVLLELIEVSHATDQAELMMCFITFDWFDYDDIIIIYNSLYIYYICHREQFILRCRWYDGHHLWWASWFSAPLPDLQMVACLVWRRNFESIEISISCIPNRGMPSLLAEVAGV